MTMRLTPMTMVVVCWVVMKLSQPTSGHACLARVGRARVQVLAVAVVVVIAQNKRVSTARGKKVATRWLRVVHLR
jgi:hypothetical protein